MRDGLRDKLNTEMTRQQFLQFMGAALLMVFGIDNLLSFLNSSRLSKHFTTQNGTASTSPNGFGTRRFGE